MKHLILTAAIFAYSGNTLADSTSAPSPYPMANAVGCKMMVRGALPPALSPFDLSKVESATCACVDEKMHGDVVMSTVLGTDDVAKKKLVGRENFQAYMIAKGMSYMFACIAPALSQLADEAFERKLPNPSFQQDPARHP